MSNGSRRCTDCKHFDLNLGYDGGFGVSGPGEAECEKGHWCVDPGPLALEQFRLAIAKAHGCSDYEMAIEVT